jgi:RNA polymerase sigma-70 factor (ECF subfamily)
MTVKEYNRSVVEYADAVYRFIRADMRDDDRANDVVQDSYEKLWRNVADIDFRVAKSWLFTTAYHTMIDIIRKESRITGMEAGHELTASHEDNYSDLNEVLHEALTRLPEIQRSSVLLRDYEGYSYREIGEITGQTEAQVKINIYRGRVALKNYIGKIETVI